MRRLLIRCVPPLAAALLVGARLAAAGEAATVEARLLDAAARPGEAVRAEVRLAPAEGVHLYRDQTKVELVEPGTLFLRPFELPAGKKVADPFSGETAEYYLAPVSFAVPVFVPADFRGDRVVFTLRVRFQGCTDNSCYPPAFRDFRLEAPVEAGAARAGPPPAVTEPQPESAPVKRPAILFILLAFLAGLGVCYTPCVYPMIPVTVALIGGVAGGRVAGTGTGSPGGTGTGSPAAGRKRFLSPDQGSGSCPRTTLLGYTLIYILGIAISYAVLGAVAAKAGQAMGRLMQRPEVLVPAGAIMALLALSMFGAFDLALPPALTGWMGRISKAGSLPALLVSGLVVGLVASPCVSAPLSGLLFAIIKSQDWVLGGLALFAFAWGMSALLVVAGMVPGLLARPGRWMLRVKTVFGVILAAMAFYFVRSVLPAGLFGWPGLLVAAAAGTGLLAAGRRLAEDGRGRGWVRGAGAIALVFAAYLGLGAAVRSGALESFAEAVLPPSLAVERAAPERPRLPWQPYSREAREAARRAGAPVIVDFYADWCAYCRQIERRVFADGRVAAESRRFALLRVDGSEADSAAARAAEQELSGGYPTVLIYDSRGELTARFAGPVQPGPFLEKMRAAR